MTPTIITDNFLKYPNKVLDFSKQCTFYKDPDGKWPGKRSEALHTINENLFSFLHKKVFSILYPHHYEEIMYSATSSFQKIGGNDYNHEGWVHNDGCELTVMIYLSNHNGCGTSFWEPKEFVKEPINYKEKYKLYRNEITASEALPYLKENNNLFNKTLTVNSKFNRLLVFDSKTYHSAESFKDVNCDEDRLTFISFIHNFHHPKTNLKNPILENMRVD
tara:strand:- start:199 stop:855 length:657 start_codon:yes stop_codon:yes gene_type:complete